MDSTSGQFEPASGAWASFPGKEYWPEGMVSHVRVARAPEPVGKSEGKPSYGRNPGSRRKKYKGQGAASDIAETSEDHSDQTVLDNSDNILEEPKDPSEEFVVYKAETEEENLTSYELDKRLGRPHPFIDPSVVKPIEEPPSSEGIEENLKRNNGRDGEGDAQMLIWLGFAKVMVGTGQIKVYGDHPVITETALAMARRHTFKEERLHAERMRLEEIGPLAYHSKWVKAWDGDTSCESVQKHFKETGEMRIPSSSQCSSIKLLKNTAS